jgi:putative hydrolase of the HAD superfamily
MAFPLFIFDLDNTLYPRELPIWHMVDERIEQYVMQRLGVDAESARRARMDYLAEYGSTLQGLVRHHGVRHDEYLEYIHDVPASELVPKNPRLGKMLDELPGKCVVFTNGSREYALRVLSALGVTDRMEEVFGIEFMEYIAKPSPYPYEKLLRAMNAVAKNSLFCDDSRRNLLPAYEMGIFTVQVGESLDPHKALLMKMPPPSFKPHAVIGDICELPDVLHAFPPMARA